jgi:serine/threonine protein kinase
MRQTLHRNDTSAVDAILSGLYLVNGDKTYAWSEDKASLLGQGTFGKVYRAWPSDSLGPIDDDDHPYAIKVMEARGRSAALRAVNEVSALWKLQGIAAARHILVLEAVQRWGHAEIRVVTEYCPGTTLRTLIKSPDPSFPTLRHVHSFTAQLADALAACHAAGITHHDVKPANCMITPDRERLTLIDFGFACFGSTLEEYSQTPLFSAPELLARTPHTNAVDMYAFGVTVYLMLHGGSNYPFRRSSLSGLADAVLGPRIKGSSHHGEQRAPALAAPLVITHDGSPSLRAIMVNTLARDATVRWTARHVLGQLLEAGLATSADVSVATQALSLAEEEEGGGGSTATTTTPPSTPLASHSPASSSPSDQTDLHSTIKRTLGLGEVPRLTRKRTRIQRYEP